LELLLPVDTTHFIMEVAEYGWSHFVIQCSRDSLDGLALRIGPKLKGLIRSAPRFPASTFSSSFFSS
jgi:hypothetical protein